MTLRPRRFAKEFWAVASLLLPGAAIVALHIAQAHMAAESAQLRSGRAAVDQALRKARDSVADGENLGASLSPADRDRLLAPVNRLRVAEELERQAKAYRLAHVIYAFAPERRTRIGAQNLASSVVTLNAEAALDTDVFAFIERVTSVFPGRMRLTELTLGRAPGNGPTPSAYGLRVGASFVWLSNGALVSAETP